MEKTLIYPKRVFIALFLLIIPAIYTLQVIIDEIKPTIILNAEQEEINETAEEIIQKSRKGSIKAEFPSEFYKKTLKEIIELSKSNKKDISRKAKKALKLLKDGRFKK